MKKVNFKTILILTALSFALSGLNYSQTKTEGKKILSTDIQHFNTENTITAPIKFNIEKKGDILISVFNYKGEFVEVLVDGEMEPGDYNVYFKTFENLESGLYYYTLSINGNTEIIKSVIF